jgi:hypothetical protein
VVAASAPRPLAADRGRDVAAGRAGAAADPVVVGLAAERAGVRAAPAWAFGAAAVPGAERRRSEALTAGVLAAGVLAAGVLVLVEFVASRFVLGAFAAAAPRLRGPALPAVVADWPVLARG